MIKYNNILIIQTAFIGDAILASSLAEKVHAFFPEAKVSILVRKGNESIYDQHPFIKEVLVWNKKEKKTLNLFRLLFKLRERKFDCVINCHRFASSGFLTAFSGARHTAGYKQTPFACLLNTAVKHVIGDGRHETERYNQLIEDFTDSEVHMPRLYPSAADFERVANLQTSAYVCLAPGSVWFTKQLPVEKWVELADRSDPNTCIYLVGAMADLEICEKIKSRSTHPNIDILAGQLSLLQSAALMKGAKMNYVNDSAPLHLASAVNAPVTAFFCSTIPEFGFGPLSQKSSIVQVNALACRPCGLHGYKSCPIVHFKCGNLIEIKDVATF
jgi:heptosyltransferase II